MLVSIDFAFAHLSTGRNLDRPLFNCIQSERGWGKAISLRHNFLSLPVFVRELALSRFDEFSNEQYEKIPQTFLLHVVQFESCAMGFSGRKSPRRWSCSHLELLEFPPFHYNYMYIKQRTQNPSNRSNSQFRAKRTTLRNW